MFSKNEPAAVAMTRVLNDFAAVEELLVLATAPGDAPAPEKLTAFADRLERAVAGDAKASRLSAGVLWRADAEQKAFFEKVLVPNGLFYLDDTAFNAAQQRLTRPEMEKQIRRNESMIATPGPAAQALSKVLLKDPLHLHEFVLDKVAGSRPFKTYDNSDAFLSADGQSILIRVRGTRPVSDLEFSHDFTESIEHLSRQVNGDALELHFAGSYAIAAASQKAIRADMIASVVSSVVLLQVLFLVAYRRPFRSFLLALTPVAVGILYGFGAYAVLTPTLTPINAVIGGILAGMAIDYSIQFLAHYERRRASTDAAAAAVGTLKTLWPAMLAAWATSVIGFAAIGSSDVKALKDFSLLGALGLTGAFVATLALLPALLVITTRRTSTGDRLLRFNPAPLLATIAARPEAPLLVAGVLLVVSVGVVLLPGDRLPLESDLAAMHPKPNPALDAQDIIARRMGMAPGALAIHLRASSASELLALAHDVQRRLNTPTVKEAGVTATYGLATLLPDPTVAPSRVAAIGPAVADRVVGDFQSVIEDSLFQPKAYAPYTGFLRHMLTARSAPGIDALVPYRSLAETVLPKSTFAPSAPAPTEAVTLVFLGKPTEQRAVRDTAVAAIRAALDGLPGATLTGLSVLSHDAELNVRRQLPRLIAVAFGIVAAYLLVHFRNLADCSLAVLHTLFSLVCLLAFMRLTGQKLNMMNLVAFPLLIGIDVDYAIFLITSVRQRARMTADQLVDHLATNASAVLLCAASTFLGFGSLITTSVPAVRSLGTIVAAGIACSLLATFFLVTPLVLILSARQRKTPAHTDPIG
jgi:predicted RND superfamily exporter protein